jgi:hypothetical protein
MRENFLKIENPGERGSLPRDRFRSRRTDDAVDAPVLRDDGKRCMQEERKEEERGKKQRGSVASATLPCLKIALQGR